MTTSLTFLGMKMKTQTETEMEMETGMMKGNLEGKGEEMISSPDDDGGETPFAAFTSTVKLWIVN